MKVLDRLVHTRDFAEAAETLVRWAREVTGCEVALLRVVEPGDDSDSWIPACACAGGTDSFLRDETLVGAEECLCGHIITGSINPSLPFFTSGGAFVWGRVGTITSDFELKDIGPLRGRCMAEGFDSVAILPVIAGDTIVGCLHLADHRAHLFQETAGLVEEVCRAAGGILAKRAGIVRDEAVLRAIRSVLAPPLRLALPGLQLGVSFSGADDVKRAGGDFYDLIELGPRKTLLFVGDYSGKGIEAMGMAERARYLLGNLAHEVAGAEDTADTAAGTAYPAAFLAAANQALLAQLRPERFVAAAICIVDLDALTAQVGLAGHPEPLLFSAARIPATLEMPYNPPLGAFTGVEFATTSVSLSPGDLLIIATDGVLESRRRGQLLGASGVESIVRENGHGDVSGIAQSVCLESVRFHDSALPSDDRLVLVAKILGQELGSTD